MRAVRSGAPWRWPATVSAAVVAALLTFGVTAPAHAAGADPSSEWAGNTANTTGGTDYYIDSSGGDDSAAGTSPGAAWKTLAKANATTFQPGDRILLKGGDTWNDEQLWPKGSGTESAPITIDAYGNPDDGLPYISTNGHVPAALLANGTKNPDTVGLSGAVVLRNQEYWNIAHLELSNDDDFNTNMTTGNVVRDGVSVSINADLFAPGDNTIMHGIHISDLNVHDIDGPDSWQKIYEAGVDFQVFGKNQYGSYGTGGYYFQGSRVENNTFTHVELNAVQFGFNWWGDSVGYNDSTGKFHEGWEQLWIRDRDLYSRDIYIGHNYAESIGQGAYQFGDIKNLVAEYNEANGWLQRYNGVSAGLYLWAGADSVMRYNEIYGGPAQQYDATPWDLEYTNFNVTYEYNYSHDNLGGWMSYMGNSSNSIARYNLSVNDNGVIWKNMLSTNYSPTYVMNNVIVYDGSKLSSFHDAVLKDKVYFANNIFYNSSKTTTTKWFTQPGALANGVFTNNAYYEASGKYSPNQPTDAHAVIGDPQFVGNPADYAKTASVDDILTSVAPFAISPTSPLVDKGRYNAHIGTKDFLGNANYRGKAPDIGLAETANGAVVTNPVDTDPIENIGKDGRTDLALNKPITATSTHAGAQYAASRLVDGDKTTRWAADDVVTYPLNIDIDFGAPTAFDEVDLSEFTDSGTKARVANYSLQKWDDATNSWVTFSTQSAMGVSAVVKDFGVVTSSKLRLSIASLLPGSTGTPTMTEIGVYSTKPVTDPTVTPDAAVFDRNAAKADAADNQVAFTVDPDGDTLQAINYVTPAGAIVGALGTDDYTTSDADGKTVYRISPAFLAGKDLGSSGLQFSFESTKTVKVSVEIIDSTALTAAVADADALKASDYTADSWASVKAARDAGAAVLAKSGVTQAELDAATSAITSAKAGLASAVRTLSVEPSAEALPTGTAAAGAAVFHATLADGSTVTLTDADVTASGWDSSKAGTVPVTYTVRSGLVATSGSPVTATVSFVFAPAWSASTAYTAGGKVVYDGTLWVASWWTQNQKPGDVNGSWQQVRTAPDGTAIWTPTRVFNTGDVVVYQGERYKADYWTRNQTPGDPNGPWEQLSTTSDGTVLWTASRIFTAGDIVSYQGKLYEAKWWTRNQAPGDAKGPWQLVG
ncbi:hypothetical protein GCM10027568_28440 [Humibacter soli]